MQEETQRQIARSTDTEVVGELIAPLFADSASDTEISFRCSIVDLKNSPLRWLA